MYMSDYVEQLDRILSSGGRKLLNGPGRISHKQAMEKAEQEYRKYEVQNLSPVEEAYLETIRRLDKDAKKGSRKN